MKNFFSSKKFVSTAALLAIVVSSQASAAIAPNITFGGQEADDNSGLTSDYVNASNIEDGSNGFFIETFDVATNPGAPGSDKYNEGAPGEYPECAVNGLGGDIQVNTSADDSFGVRTGSVDNVAAAPFEDDTCYGHTPSEDGVLPSWVEIDYSVFLAGLGEPLGITYLGFYWGSVDEYNDFTFYSGDDEIGEIKGKDLLAQANAESGNQTDPASNQYVNIDFSFDQAFDRVRITSTGIAGEFDNIVIGLAGRPVPAPAGLAFLGLGLLGLSFSRKFKK